MSNGVRLSEIQQPSSDATVSPCVSSLTLLHSVSPPFTLQEAELAWHFFLPGLTSGYMYYGGVEDMPVKQTVAANNAVVHGQKAISA